jgi:ferredoxin-NADP reductase
MGGPMQPIIERFTSTTEGRLGFALGIILVGILLAFILGELIRTFLRIRAERTQHRATMERLRLQLLEARLRCEEARQAQLQWNGYRKFEVSRKVIECEDVCAIYLKPHDGKALAQFKPGQYLTFQLSVPGRDKPLVRCYSLSDSPHRSDYYRITVKKERAPADRPDLPCGAASSYFADNVKEGDILDVKAPSGHFFLEMAQTHPIVLIAGGVGVTPMLSMAQAIAASNSKREVWFFFGVRNSQEHIHKEELASLAAKNDNIHLHVCYSRPLPRDVKGRDYAREGRVSIEALKELLPSNNFEYYLCGNGSFMKSLTDGLEAWGVPEKDVHFEAFGPATVKKKAPEISPDETKFLAKTHVTFKRSGKKMSWDPNAGNLLDLALANGVRIEAGCRAGGCGSCLVAIKSGSVTYLSPPDATPEEGACLTCICRPSGDLELDA